MDSLLNRLATLGRSSFSLPKRLFQCPLDAHHCVSTPLRLHSGHWIPDCQKPSSAEVARCFGGKFTANYFIPPPAWFVPPRPSPSCPPPPLPFLSYNIDLCLLMLRKLEGQLIAQSPPLHRLMELRVLLEKVRPLDQKFRYQIDKSIRAATSAVNQEDSLSFKANPHDFAKVECDGGGGTRVRRGWV